MRRNSKSDNERFTLFEDGTLHLYDNLHEVEHEEHTEYEGELYITKTNLTQAEVEAQFDSLLAVEKQKWQVQVAKAEAEKAQKNLDATDYIDTQLNRIATLYGLDSDEYKALREKRLPLLMQREQWAEIVRNAK